jgi:hypothetical protein
LPGAKRSCRKPRQLAYKNILGNKFLLRNWLVVNTLNSCSSRQPELPRMQGIPDFACYSELARSLNLAIYIHQEFLRRTHLKMGFAPLCVHISCCFNLRRKAYVGFAIDTDQIMANINVAKARE